MKKLLIAILACTMILSGCTTEKKYDYKDAISSLKDKYASDSVITDTVQNFVNTAIAKAGEKADIKDVAFMASDNFDSIKTYVEEHKEELTYIAIGIGAIVIAGNMAVLVLKTACIASILAIACNYIEAKGTDELEVSSFDSVLDQFKESEDSADLAQSLKNGSVVVLRGFADWIDSK